MAAALIDRLVHHSHIVNIRGDSYRMRHRADLAQLIQRRQIAPPLGWLPKVSDFTRRKCEISTAVDS